MRIEAATSRALHAAETGDLDELTRALQARGEAIASGQLPTPEIVASGERLRVSIELLKREAWADSARLRRIQQFLPGRGAGS
jgi:hypothetical protein